MKKIVAALASALLVTTAFAQTAATDAGKAQLKANSEKTEAQATANKAAKATKSKKTAGKSASA